MGKKKKRAAARQEGQVQQEGQVPKEPASGLSKSAGSKWQPAYARARADKPDPIDWKILLTTAASVLMIAFCTHIFSINDGMVLTDRANLDFIFNQQKLPEVAEQSIENMGKRPLMQPWTKYSFISDRIDYQQSFNKFHGANILFHAAAAGYLFAFVFQLIRELGIQKRLSLNPYFMALGAGAIFATHPFTCETVSYLSARGMLLGATNFFLALNFLILGMLSKNVWISIGGYGIAVWTGCMAIWSCPEMVSLPVVALFTALILKAPLKEWKKTFAENKILAGVLSLLSIAVPLLAIRGFEAITAINQGTPILGKLEYVASQLKAIPLYYLRCFIAPVGLSIDPPMAVASGFTDPFVWAGAALIAALLFAAWRWRSIPTGLAALFLLAGFVPHAVFIQPDTVADWVTYLPLAGVAILAGAFFAEKAQKNFKGAIVLLLAAVVLLADLSIFRDSQWASNLSLWSSALEVRPKSALAHAMLAMELAKRKQIEEADANSAQAISLAPELCLARIARGTVLLARERFNAAEEQFIAARNLADSQKLPARIKQDIKYGLVEAYLMQGQIQKAQSLLSELITADVMARDGRAFRIAGLAAFKGHQYEMAIQRMIDALKADSQLAQCWEQIAISALELGNGEGAYTAATNWKEQLDSDAARLLLARAALAADKAEEGELLLMDLLSRNPKDADAAYVLSRHYKRIGKEAEAKKFQDQAVKLVPDIESKVGHLPEMDRPFPSKAEGLLQDHAPATPKRGESPVPGKSSTPSAKDSSDKTSTSTASPSRGDKPASSDKSSPTPTTKGAPSADKSPTPTSTDSPSADKTAPASSEKSPSTSPGAARSSDKSSTPPSTASTAADKAARPLTPAGVWPEEKDGGAAKSPASSDNASTGASKK